MKSLLFAKGSEFSVSVIALAKNQTLYKFGNEIYMYMYNSSIVLNIVIPPLVTSCKILIISMNFLSALAARKG